MEANHFKIYKSIRLILLLVLFSATTIPSLAQNYALSFDGSGDYVAFGNPAGLQIPGSQTLEMWLYPQSLNARRNPLAKAYAGEGTITLETDGTLLYYYGTGGANNSPYMGFSSGSKLTVEAWTHVALVRDLSAMKLYWYFDGVQVAETPAQFTYAQIGTLPFYIGRGYVNDFHGRIDEVRVWNVARSHSDIAAFYDEGLTGYETGLAAYWPFNEGSGDVIYDNTPNGINGTRNGNAQFITQAAPINPPAPGTEAFESVPPTGLPYNIVLSNLIINGTELPVGAQVGVFDGELCVGTAFYSGNPNQNMIAWKADPEQNLAGFTTGHPMTFKIHTAWYSEVRNFDASKTMVKGNGNFGFGTYSVVNLSVTTSLVPAFNISTEILNFNAVIVNQSKTLPLVFENTGTAILSVNSIFNSTLFFTKTITALQINPGETATMDITFSPAAVTTYTDLLNFVTDDPGSPSFSVPLYGTGLPQPAAQITVTPSSLNFGGIAKNSIKTMTLNILNPGNGTLNVTGITSSNPAYTLFGGTSFSLGQGENRNVSVVFSPTQSGVYNGQLTITNNVQTQNIPLSGIASQGHFTSVSPTGKPYSIVVDDVNIDGFRPIVGDEVAVFDGELCVGNGISGSGGNSLQLNGSNSYLINDNSSAFDLQQLTISAWVYSSNFAHNGFIFEKGPVNSQYSLFFEGSNINFRTVSSSGGLNDFYVSLATAGILNNQWNHIAATYDGLSKILYVNGQLKAIQANTATLRTSQAGQIIGAYGATGGHSYFFNGNIDEVRVYDYARSLFEIESDMYIELQGTETGLVGYWDFNDGNVNNRVAGATPSYLNGGATVQGSQNNQIFANMLITAWEKDDALGLPGFTSGNPMTFKVWTEVYDNWVEVNTVPEYIIGNGNFGYGQMSVLTLEGTSGLEPDIRVPIENLYVGQVTVGSSVVNNIQVFNQGNAPLNFTISDNSTAFSSSITTGTIPAASSVTFQVTFSPTTPGGYSGVLTIQSNDPDEPQVTIGLEGFALPAGSANIATSVNLINFENVEVGTSKVISLFVINTGTTPLTVTGISFNNSVFSASPSSFTLQNTNDLREVFVTFHPTDKGAYQGTMTISSNAPQKVVSLSGTGFDNHFNVVSPTGLPYTIIVNETNLDEHLQPGDELGVFDGSVCAGLNSPLSSDMVLSLDGNGDFVEIPDDPSLDLNGNQMTVEAWVKVAAYSGDYRCIIGKIGWSNSGDWSYNLHIADNGTLHFNFVNASGTSFPVNSPDVIGINAWHHVAATYNGSLIKLYIDGLLETSLAASGNIRQNNQTVKIGAWYSSDVNYFNGKLNDIRLWNYARSQAQIQASMNATLTGTETGLAGCWNFELNNANDLSQNENNGTLIGNAIVVSDWIISENQSITAWQADPLNGLPGFTPGNPMSFKIWTEINGFPSELIATPTYLVGNGNFGYGQFTVVNLEFGLPEIAVEPQEVFVALEEPDSTNRTLTIYNTGEANLQFDIPDPFLNGVFNASYYYSPGSGASPGFGSFVFETEDEFINTDWGGGGPGNGVGSDDFQIKWTGLIYAQTEGNYQFRSVTDDGVRLFVDSQLIIDYWYEQGATSRYGSINLSQGFHELEFQYYENGGGAAAYLFWTPPGKSEELVPASDIPWLTVSPSSGIVSPSQSIEITLSANSSGLNDGLYEIDLLINNNTLENTPVIIPVSLNITGNPQIASSVQELEFGQVVVNSTSEKNLTLQNIGTKDLIIQDISVLQGIASGFSYSLNAKSFPLTIPPGQSVDLTVGFTPELPGQVIDTLMVQSNAVNAASYPVQLTGEGITPPEIYLPQNVFNYTLPCNDDRNESLKVKNIGQSNLQITLTSDQSWLVATPSPATVAGGDSVSITIHISTLDLFAGLHVATLTIQSNDPDNLLVEVLYSITVTGNPAILCNDFINIGTAFVGDTLVGQLTVANSGCDVLEVFSVGVQSQYPVFFINNPVLTIPPGEADVLEISFVPAATQQYSGIITINSNDPATTSLPVVVSANGVEPPSMLVNPLSISATVQSGNTSQKSFVVKNTGGQVLNFTSTADGINPYMLRLDGNGDYINVVHSNLLNPTNAITLEAWIYLYDNTNEFIIGKENSTEGKYRFLVNSNSRFEFELNNQHVVTSNIIAGKNQWYHVAATFDGASMRIFINGNLDAEKTFSPFTIEPNTDNLRIGRSYQFAYFNGSMDEIRIWNIARNQSEIQSAMNQALLGTEPELLLYFPFGNASGNIVLDASTYGHNGILYGNPVRQTSTIPFDDYMTLANGSGNLNANQQQNVNLSLNTTGFFAQNYQRQIEVTSNAVANPSETVSLSLTIEGADNIIPNPTQIAFQNTFIGLRDTFALILENTGATAVQISDIAFSSPVFSNLTPVNKVFPFSQKTLDLAFAPTLAQLFEGVLTISFGDGKTTQIQIPLSGVGVTPPIPVFNPELADFGSVVVNHTATVNMNLSNAGNSTLVVNSFSFTNDALFTSNLQLPQTIPFGQQIQFEITFTPLNYNPVNEQMLFNTNIGLVSVPLTGTGVPPDHDLAVTTVLTPENDCGLTSAEALKISVKNFGVLPQSNFDVGFSLDNGPSITETINATLPSGQTLVYTFNQTLNLSVVKTYNLEVFTLLGNDQNTLNDTLVSGITNFPSVGNFTNLLPADSTFEMVDPVTFSWSAVNNASQYDLYLWRTTQQKPASPTVSGITGTSYTYYDYLNKNYLYNWQMVARNQCSGSLSPVRIFSFNIFSDLTVTNIIIPPTALAGEVKDVSFTINNIGTGSTGWVPWEDEVYLSPLPNFDFATANKVSTTANLNRLLSGQSYSRTISFTLSNYLEGLQYIFVRTDATNKIQETNENNNLIRSVGAMIVNLPPYPDLSVSGIQSLSGNIVPGGSLTVGWMVENVGDATANGGWSQKVSIVSGNQRLLLGYSQNMAALGVGEILAQSANFTIPQYPGLEGDVYLEVALTPYPALIEKPNATANNTALSANSVLFEKHLFISLPQPTINENSPNPMQGMVYRSGNRNQDLVVNLSVSLANRINLPATVTIPVNQSGVAFNISVINNNLIEGNIDVLISAIAPDYFSTNKTLTVIDDEFPSLIVNTNLTEVSEGETFQLTITRDLVTDFAQMVNLSVNKSSQIVLPATASIPEGAASVTLDIPVVEDNIPELTVVITISATATGFLPGIKNLSILDDDLPQVELILNPDTVSEAGGPFASWGTVKRLVPGNGPITILLSANPAGGVFFPAQVTIQGSLMEQQFNIGAVDNGVLDGARQVEITAAIYLSSCGCGAPPESGGTATASLTLLDNDGPSLSVLSNPFVVPEGVTNAGILTLKRNTLGGNQIQVNIQHNGNDEIQIQSEAIIPEGQDIVEVPFNTIDDGIEDGDQVVSVSVTSENYSPGTCWLMVSDRNLPDFVLKSTHLSKSSILLNEQTEFSITVVNNGFAVAPAGAEVKIFKSTNNSLDNGDLLLSTLTTPSIIVVGDSIVLNQILTFSENIGNYYIIAAVNKEGLLNELIGINNTSEAKPLSVYPDYNATATVEGDVFNGTTPITITGVTEMVSKVPSPNKAVDVYVVVNGVRRVYQTTSDNNGNFSVDFLPLNGEAGDYYVGACFPGQGLNEAQDTFVLLGAKHTANDFIIWNLWLGETKQQFIEIRNLSSIDLNNVQIEVISRPQGCLVNFQPVPNLPGNSYATISYSVQATQVTQGSLYEEVKLKLTTSEGTRFNFSTWFYSSATKGNLQLSPVVINTTMVKDQINYTEFEVLNNGMDETGLITVNIPELNWMSLVNADTISSLQPGESAIVTLRLMPGDDLQLNNPITGQLALSGTNANSVALPFSIMPISIETGDLLVDVVDEYTYNTEEAPHVDSATVIISHPYTGQIIAQGLTDANGHFLVEDINEGYYVLKVEAPRHGSYQDYYFIEKGVVNTKVVFIAFQAITYSWNVVPTVIEDEYEITLVVQFETNVPAPVVVMDMPGEFPYLDQGEYFPFILILTNQGLITAKDVEVILPEDEEYMFTANVAMFDLLPQQAVQIPVLMERKPPTMGSETKSPACAAITITKYKFECGPDNQMRIASAWSIYLGRICTSGGSGPLGTIPYFWPMGPSGPGGPNNYSGGYTNVSASQGTPYTSSNTGCDPCVAEALNCAMDCINPIPPVLDCGADVYANGINWNNGIGCLWGVVDTFTGGKFGCAWCIGTTIGCFINQAFSGGGGGGGIPQGKELVSSDLEQVFDDMTMLDKGFVAIENYAKECAGSDVLFAKDFFGTFNDSIAEFVNNELPIDPEAQNNLLASFENTDITETEILDFITYWNTSMEAWNNGVFSPTPEYPDIIDTLLLHQYQLQLDTVIQYTHDRGYASMDLLYNEGAEIAGNQLETESSSVCATVTVQFSQTLTMTREAFEGTLTIFNGHETDAMQNIMLDLEVRDENGVLRNDLFQINTQSLDQISGIDGTGVLNALTEGKAVIMFIPERGAAPDVPISYSFGGTLSYLDPFTGEIYEQPLFPVTLQVNPSPNLYLNYFMQRDIFSDDALTEPIEPMIPAELAVMIDNQGAGTAMSVKLESAQPVIVENEKGLLIEFNILGSNLGGQPRQLGLYEVDFGDIKGGEIAVGQWWFTSTLLGHFISYEASVNHLDSYGNPDLSLVSGVDIHELIKSISVYGPLDDTINDFLVNDNPDSEDIPDKLYYSNGIVATVVAADDSETDGPVTFSDTIVELTVTPSAEGWNYTRLDDPGNGLYRIASVTRNDGQIIPLDNVWLTYSTIPDGGEPIYENKLHFVDAFGDLSAATYTIVFEPIDQDTPEVVAINGIPEEVADIPVEHVEVVFSEAIEPSTFNYEDMVLKNQGGPNLMDSLVIVTQVTDSTFDVDISAKTSPNGYYTLTVQAAGVSDLVGNFGKYGMQVAWLQAIASPAIDYFIGLSEIPEPIDTLLVIFNMPINEATFTTEQLILEDDDGNQIPTGSLVISPESFNSQVFKISGLLPLSSSDGTYQLTFRVTEILGETGFPGLVDQSVEWTVCQIPLPIVDAGEDGSVCIGSTYQLAGSVQNASSFSWSTSGTGTFDNNQILNPVYTPGSGDFAAGSVEIRLTAQPLNDCAASTTSSLTLTFINAVTANAGEDATICQNSTHQLFGTVSHADGFYWITAGNGTFSSAGTLAPVYTPGTLDIAAGSVELSLIAQPQSPCVMADTSALILTIQKLPTAYAGPIQFRCQDQQVQLQATASNYSNVYWYGGTGTMSNRTILNPVYTFNLEDIQRGYVNFLLVAEAESPCFKKVYSITRAIIRKSPVANAGSDKTICENQILQLAGSVVNAIGLHWETSGDGLFNNANIPNATYTPGTGDIAATTVEITLTALPINPCVLADVSSMILEIQRPAIANAGEDGVICYGETFAVSGTIENAISSTWETTGDGTFENPSSLVTNYYPGYLDLQNGIAALMLNAQPVAPCIVVTTDDLLLTVNHCQDVTIPAGWSGISGYVQPAEPSLENIFSNVLDDLVILQSETGIFWPGENINTIGNWSRSEGYKIKAENQIQLGFTGAWNGDNNLPLAQNWNLIPVLSSCQVPVEDLFNGTTVTIVKEVAGWRVYWPAYGINTLGTIEPGSAYYVRMPATGSITFPDCEAGTYKAGLPEITRRFVYSSAKEDAIFTPFTHTIAFPPGLDFKPGTQIVVYDEQGNCCGVVEWQETQTALTVFGDDPFTTVKDGAVEGEQLTFVTIDPENGFEEIMEVAWDEDLPNSDGRFYHHGLSAMKEASLSAHYEFSGSEEITIFPNPAKEFMVVASKCGTGLKIRFFNQIGVNCLETETTEAVSKIDVSGLVNGIYMISITCENETVVRKLVIN